MVQIAENIPLDGRGHARLRRRQKRLLRHGKHAVAHAEFVIVAVGVVVPYMHAVVRQILYVGIAREKPQQFADNAFQEHALSSQQRKPLLQIEAHLMAENAARARTRAVAFHHAFAHYLVQQVEILFHDSNLLSSISPSSPSAAYTGSGSSHAPRNSTRRSSSRTSHG